MRESKVSVLNGEGEKLVGIKSLPEEKRDKYPTVLLVHGFNDTKEEGGMFDKLAGHLTEGGFLVYRFDFSGCGESEGDYSKTSLSKILKWVKSQKKVGSIGILAQSFGTTATVALEPEVKALVLMGSISHPKEIISRLFGDGYQPDGVSSCERSDGHTATVGPQFWPDLENHALFKCMQRIQAPVLFIHGSMDFTVPISDMSPYFEVASDPKKRLILEGADHGLRPKRKEMYSAVVDWFGRFL